VKGIIVTTKTGTGPGTLFYAVNQANGDRSNGPVSIIIDPSLASATIQLTAATNIVLNNSTLNTSIPTWNESIAIEAPAAGVYVSGAGSSTKFSDVVVAPNTVASITGLTIEYGNANDGGGVYVSAGAVLMVDAVTFYENSATNGGAVYSAAGGDAVIFNSKLWDNSARYGAGVDNVGLAVLVHTTFLVNIGTYYAAIVSEGFATTIVWDQSTQVTLGNNYSWYNGQNLYGKIEYWQYK
jgi:predicted outer membrane repeat protein